MTLFSDFPYSLALYAASATILYHFFPPLSSPLPPVSSPPLFFSLNPPLSHSLSHILIPSSHPLPHPLINIPQQILISPPHFQSNPLPLSQSSHFLKALSLAPPFPVSTPLQITPATDPTVYWLLARVWNGGEGKRGEGGRMGLGFFLGEGGGWGKKGRGERREAAFRTGW